MVKKTSLIIGVIFFLMFVGFFMLALMSASGTPPGLVSGSLTVCSDKPNCVMSEIADDESHFIAPLDYPVTMTEDAMALLKQIIRDLGGEIISDEDEYLAATFTSSLFGFVDDLECRHDWAKHIIHFRSASRMGQSDFGVNRKRVELISQLFNQRISHMIE